MYAKDLDELKYQQLINNGEKAGINFNNDPTAFIEYSSSMGDICSKMEDYNRKRKMKVLIIFDDIISHIMSHKKAQQILKDLFTRCRKLNISLWLLIKNLLKISMRLYKI